MPNFSSIVAKAGGVSGEAARALYDDALRALEHVYGQGKVWSRATDAELAAMDDIERRIGSSAKKIPQSANLSPASQQYAPSGLDEYSPDGRRFFRFYRRGDDPMSDWGHAMYLEADTPYNAEARLAGYGSHVFELDRSAGKFPDIASEIGNIRKQIAQDYRKGDLPDEMRDALLSGTKMRDLISEFAPQDIVNSAGAWDGAPGTWFVDRFAIPNGYAGVTTPDGAIAFDRDSARYIAKRSGLGLPDGLRAIGPLAVGGAVSGGLMASPEETWAAYRATVPPTDAIEEAWNPVEALAGGLGGGLKSALAGVPIDAAMDYALGKVGGLMSGHGRDVTQGTPIRSWR